MSTLVPRLTSRRTRTLLPSKATLLQPQVPNEGEQQRLLRKPQETQAHYYNRTAEDLPNLQIGDLVRMKPINNSEREWSKGTVT